MLAAFATAGGWRRRGIAALLGALATAALPPCFLLPLLVPAFSGLFLLTLNAPTRRQAFLDGWWWGLGHFTTGLYWICISLYVEPEKFAWLTPFALFGLPSVIAIYIGLVTLALYGVQKRITPLNPTTMVFAFAAFWIAAEYLRACLFTGFPWNLIGYAWNISDVTLQAASVWGIYGQSWLAVTLAAAPALFFIPGARPLPLNVASGCMLLALIAFGATRLADNPTQYTDTMVRVVQGNIAQEMKFDPKTAMKGLRKYADLTRQPGIEKVNIVVWPETAVPYIITPDSALPRDLGSLLKGDTLLFTGGMRGEGDEQHFHAWNSAFVITSAGAVAATYDKYHLVPFGEYIPLRHVLPLEAIAGGMGDFSIGSGPVTLTPAGVPPFSPLICYEAIFPGKATDGTGRATWLANVTNDAWFGVSSGPFQHLEMARARAVEEGLPLVRAANTGISVITDSFGRVLKSLPSAVEGVIDNPLPKAAGFISIYSRFENGLIIVIVLITLAISYAFTAVSVLKKI